MTSQNKFLYSDIPLALIEDCHRHIWNYTVGFVWEDYKNIDASVGGSGVLVKAAGVPVSLSGRPELALPNFFQRFRVGTANQASSFP